MSDCCHAAKPQGSVQATTFVIHALTLKPSTITRMHELHLYERQSRLALCCVPLYNALRHPGGTGNLYYSVGWLLAFLLVGSSWYPLCMVSCASRVEFFLRCFPWCSPLLAFESHLFVTASGATCPSQAHLCSGRQCRRAEWNSCHGFFHSRFGRKFSSFIFAVLEEIRSCAVTCAEDLTWH